MILTMLKFIVNLSCKLLSWLTIKQISIKQCKYINQSNCLIVTLLNSLSAYLNNCLLVKVLVNKGLQLHSFVKSALRGRDAAVTLRAPHINIRKRNPAHGHWPQCDWSRHVNFAPQLFINLNRGVDYCQAG